MNRTSQSGTARIAYAAFLLVVIGVTWNFLGSVPLPEGGWDTHKWPTDLIRYYYPVARYQGEMLANGELPFWNPWQLAGFPLLAAPAAGILYPPLLILTPILPPEWALEVHAVLHLFIGAWFVWLLLGRLGAGPLAATIGALAFAISDEILRQTELTSYMSTIAWIPGIFWAILALVDEPRFRRAAALAAILALSFLGGHAQGLLYAIYWAIPFGTAALLWRAPDTATRVRILGWLVPAAVLTLLFAAPQLFPSLELMFDGSRSQTPLTKRQASFGSVSWKSIYTKVTTLAAPNHLFGYPALLLGLLGLFGKKARWAKFTIAALSIVALLYILGRATPVWGFFYEMPMGKSFRVPYRIAPILLFLVSLMVGFGTQNVINLVARWKPGRLSQASVAGILALVFVGDAIRHGPPLEQYRQLRDMQAWGSTDLPRFPPEKTNYERALLVDGLKLGALNRQIKFGMVHRRMIVGDYEPILPQPYLDLLDESGLWHGRMDLKRRENRGSSQSDEMSRILNLMGVGETIAFGKLSAIVASREAGGRLEQTGDHWLVKRTNVLPRSFVVYQTHVEPDPVTARERVLSAEFQPLREAIVASGPPLLPPWRALPGSAKITDYQNNRVVVEARCHASCLLVLTDLFYPGWVARVADTVLPIIKTDVAFRGVSLPAGKHQVEFSYRPFSFRAGAWLFGIGIIGLLIGLWRDRRPTRT